MYLVLLDSQTGFFIMAWYYFIFLNLFLKYLFIYFWLRWVFVAARGLFSSCREQGLLFVAVCRLLIVVASLAAEHGL